ncbi:MAG: hypothetical protein LW806_12705, partial [Planctomycetaceae bacterium]|nr:hypothetical protein [Planctomycetaceae bacterium]
MVDRVRLSAAVVCCSVSASAAFGADAFFPGGRMWGVIPDILCDGSVTQPPLIQLTAGQIDVGNNTHYIGVQSDGTVVCWGRDTNGQASPPAGLGAVTAVSAGSDHSVALTTGGSVVCWGNNDFNQCAVPAGLVGATTITAGADFTVALRSNGFVAAWGRDHFQQVSGAPTAEAMTQIAAGQWHVVARRTDGIVRCWGAGTTVGGLPLFGQAIAPSDLGAVTRVDAGRWHSVAVRTNGAVRCWGRNSSGECTVPAEAASGVSGVAAGDGFTVALKQDGSVVAWGTTEFGESIPPANLGTVTSIEAIGSITFAFSPESADCNGNSVPDWIDIQTGAETDADGDSVPDSCEEVPLSFCASSAIPVDLVFLVDVSGSMNDDAVLFCSSVVSRLVASLEDEFDLRIAWLILPDGGLGGVTPCEWAAVSEELTRDVPVPTICGLERTFNSGEDWADATALVADPAFTLKAHAWSHRPGVTVMIPLSDEGPTNDDRCEPDSASAIENAIRKSVAWGAAVIPVVFPEEPLQGTEGCIFNRDPKTGVQGGFMEEIAAATVAGGHAVDARDLVPAQEPVMIRIAADLEAEIRNAVAVSPRRRTSCPGDTNCDGVVNALDVAIVLGGWGASGGVGDLNDDG